MVSDESDQRIADDVLPAQVDELAVPVELNQLFPWHRPRKQLVRENQWLRYSRRLIERDKRSSVSPDREVRYLTLPGIDYLDVRQLADVCRELGYSLTSTGFQSAGEGNRYVARAQLREQSLIDAGHITGRSHTYPRRFEDIVHTNGNAYRDLRSRAPFHIVNIDPCGSIASPTAHHANRLIDALYRIVELQLELMTARWLFFITADVRPDSLAPQTLEQLCEPIYENADTNEEFLNRATPILNPGEPDIRIAASMAAERPGAAFLRLFSLGLAKWLLHLARNKHWEVRTHHPYCYSTMPANDETPSMVCLAFEFLPPPRGLQDKFAVVRAEPAPDIEPGDTSVRAADKIAGMVNADHQIRSDRMLRTRLAHELRLWLEEAGYGPTVLDRIGA